MGALFFNMGNSFSVLLMLLMAVLQLGYGTDADEVIKFNCSISRRWAGVALSPEGSKRLGAGHAGVGARRARLRELLTALRDREPVAARGAVHLLS